MAGYSRIYCIGEPGGFQGADGVNPIHLQILVGDASRQWYEPHYFDTALKPLGNVQVIVPAGPDDPDALLDACLAFYPCHFRACPSLAAVEAGMRGVERLDFDAEAAKIPPQWKALRAEVQELFRKLHIWQADLTPVPSKNRG